MSAADRMVIRTRDGSIRVVPRRAALGMIAGRRATAESKPAPKPASAVKTPAAARPVKAPKITPVTRKSPEVAPEPTTPVSVTPVEPEADVTALPITAPPADVPVVQLPKGNAARKTWAAFATEHGVTVTDGMTRNMIRDAVVAKIDSDRLPQPAFADRSVTGGRLATPEDEPVTEGSVTHGSRNG